MSAWIVAALMTALLAVGPVSAASAWLRYVHPRLGFSLTYPAGWVIGPKVSGIEVMVLGPGPVIAGGVRLNANVTSESLPPGVSVAEYEEANESQLRLLFQDYRRLRTDRTKVGEYVAACGISLGVATMAWSSIRFSSSRSRGRRDIS